MRAVARILLVGTLLAVLSLAANGCVLHVTPAAAPSTASTETDLVWNSANSLYAEAVCPTNAVREALYDALATNDISQIIPVAQSASTAFDEAAGVFLDNEWPADLDKDIRFLGDTSTQLAISWRAVAASTDMQTASAVPFPDAQTPSEAAQRIRTALSSHGQDAIEC